MYKAFFGFSDQPFKLTPDPRFLYLSPRHRDALAHLLYGTGDDGGFVQLTGEVGTGKTTLVRALLAHELHDVDVALILHPRLTEQEFVASICDELRIGYDPDSASLKNLIDALNRHLLDSHTQGRRTVLIVDEAQNLKAEVLEQIRLLTNLETHRHKLLRIMLVGQPELREVLARRDMRQLAQRITARYHLTPLSYSETVAYVRHRLQVAGSKGDLFSPAAIKTAYRRSGGIPRLLNIICDRALLGAYASQRNRVSVAMVRQAAGEALAPAAGRRSGWLRPALLTTALLAVVGVAQVGGVQELALVPRLLSGWGAAETSPEPVVAATLAAPVADSTRAPAPVAPTAASSAEASPAGAPAMADWQVDSLFGEAPPERSLLADLAGLWGRRSLPPLGAEPCQALDNVQLHCFRGYGGRADLEQLNLPVLLELRSGRGERRELLLRSLDGREAGVLVNGGSHKVDWAELAALWTGQYTTVWQPELQTPVLKPGMRGNEVVWLRRRLALFDGHTGVPGSVNFDDELVRRLKVFQESRSLAVDGMAGPQTLLWLQRLAPVQGSPLLLMPPEHS